MIDVIKVIDHTRDDLVGRELMLIKVRADASERAEIMQIASVFRANLVDISDQTLMVEITGKSDKVDAIGLHARKIRDSRTGALRRDCAGTRRKTNVIGSDSGSVSQWSVNC